MYLDNERWQWAEWHQRCNGPFQSWAQFTKALRARFKQEDSCQVARQVTLPSKDFIFTEKKETMEPQGLFPTGISLLQIHGLIQKEKIIVSINPSCKHNFISVNLAKKL